MNNLSSTDQQFLHFQRFLPLTITSMIFLILFSACQDVETSNHNPSEADILFHLESQGYHMPHLNIEGEYILYEDVIIDRQAVIDEMTNPVNTSNDEDLPMNTDTRQRGVSITHALTDVNTRSGLNVYIAPSILQDCGPKVYQSIIDAVEKIRAVQNTTLNMNIVSSSNSANITIASDIDNNTFSTSSPFYDVPEYSLLANIAYNGTAGRYISVDPSWNTLSLDVIRSGMMHELGHTIGLHHTGSDRGDHIHSTPEENASSIMNPSVPHTGEFSVWDKKALRMYYAEELAKPTKLAISKVGNGIKIRYTNSKKNWYPYYWIRAYRYDANGVFDGFADFKAEVNTNGIGTITWSNQPVGSYIYRLKAMRFKKDIKSTISTKVSTNT